MTAHGDARNLSGRPRVVLRDAADINRLLVYLVTHWTLPIVEIRVDALPKLDVQHAQHRFVRLSGACNCLLGEMLGGITLLGGCYMTWVSILSWRNLGLVAVAALGVALIGKGIELAWTRVRLLLVLRDLRYRLGEILAGRQAKPAVKVLDPVLTVVGPAAGKPFGYPLNIEDGDELQNDRILRPGLSTAPERPKILLRDAADINRLRVHLVTHWALPRAEIHVDALPKLDVQRAQDRFVRLSAGYTYLLAGVLATASLLSGLFYIVWTRGQDYMWTSRQGWRDVGLVAIATLYAALIGCAIEVLWIRVRLLLVLGSLRRRLRMA